ncbi:MAG: di-trans,poly-cis-decaprenylcistransferase [Polyangiaceae bacterium]|nr:di-trans,poly-cis-decaprenylcistransferase [Polyangiaceae bacterium]
MKAQSRSIRDKKFPAHIAIILDGNGRWATTKGLPRTAGHEHGSKSVRTAVYGCHDRGIAALTLYAFSAANWSRPKLEIDTLMRLCAEFAENELEELVRRDIQVTVIGDIDELPRRTRKATEALVEATKSCKGMKLALALSYGGRQDMVSAIRQIAIRARAGLVIPEEVTEESIRSYLSTGNLPDPDLVIRTGGERRLSDFLLFECAYAELFFSETLWPDFSEETLDEAIAAFTRRQRRYGKTGAQVAEAG